MAPKNPALRAQYVTDGDKSLKEWHLLLRRVTFAAALVLMAASIVSLHWACQLIGLWEPVAWVVPLAMETGMAAVASTATTIRKDPKPGREDHPGGYYISLWVIFSFVMLLAQGSNLGHALVTVADNDSIPTVIPTDVVMVFAATFAALFPLGGTLFVHVSGFLRAHGTGARWIEDDAEVVYVAAQPGQPAHVTRTARAPQRAQTAPTERASDARTEPASRAQTPAPAARVRTSGDQERARAIFDRMVGEDPFNKPDAAAIHREAELERDTATSRRWVQRWWDEVQAGLGMPAADPITVQVEADEKAAENNSESNVA
jgi:hypothetical protein